MENRPQVYLNSFSIRFLDLGDRKCFTYKCIFDNAEIGGNNYQDIGKVLYKIGDATGAGIGNQIVTTTPINLDKLQGDGWILEPTGNKILDPAIPSERKALEQLSRRDFGNKLQSLQGQRVEKINRGFIVWDESKVERSGNGWQVLKGALVDVSLDAAGQLSLEIDSHYRFYSPWTLHQWLVTYPDAPIKFVRNLNARFSWCFLEASDEKPEDIHIPELGCSLRDYHLRKGVAEKTIQDSFVVYVCHIKGGKRSQDRVPHLSRLLQPSISMEMLGFMAEQGDHDASQVLTSVRLPISKRLNKAKEVAQYLIQRIYQIDSSNLEPQNKIATIFSSPILFARNNVEVKNPNSALQKGFLRVGELKIGCVNLISPEDAWPKLIREKLLSIAKVNNVTLDLDLEYYQSGLPEGDLKRRQFWKSISEAGVKTMLVVTPVLGEFHKTRMRREALQAGIAIQFMRPMPKPDNYRAANVLLGLMMKAGWQPIGMKLSNSNQVADLTIGFDAGTNKTLFYGTSAFAVLANGQSLGWEIPEAQLGEKFSSQAIWDATSNIITRFCSINNRYPSRVLLLRDGFVRDQEFDLTIQNLERESIAVDLVEVHKSGAGRIALAVNGGGKTYKEVEPGTGFSIAENAFRIVTSQAHAGGSARPLEVVKIHGDVSLKVLADEIFALSQFHPASAYKSSRLPMPLHYADKMIKEVQRLGQLGILHGIDRQKIFFA